uniref:Adenylate kinase active site lid domain-containing protein n=1 Tax=Alexandrium monilatum TaxID=311494 RepID=A0A7S4RI09_9DINO
MVAAAAGAAGATAWAVPRREREEPLRCDASPAQLGAALLGGLAVGGAAGLYLGKAQAAAVEEKYETYWPRKIMMVFGAPGAGKGTQGPKIVDMLGIPQLSTGDMLREAVAAGTEVGKKAKDIMASGGLVSDEIVIGIIADRIKAEDCKRGFILDGFPRTLEQAEALDAMLAKTGEAVSLVMAFDVDPAVLEERICGRWMDKASGRSYHVKFCPPKSMKLGADGKPVKETMKDDQTGTLLYQRPDDTAEALKKRLDGYKSQTVPILDHYGPKGIVKNIDGGRGIHDVWAEVKGKLGSN